MTQMTTDIVLAKQPEPRLPRCHRKLKIPSDDGKGWVTLTCIEPQHGTDLMHRDRMIIFLPYGQTREVHISWRDMGIASPRLANVPRVTKRQVRKP